MCRTAKLRSPKPSDNGTELDIDHTARLCNAKAEIVSVAAMNHVDRLF
jgi:hypothetical protein